MAQDFKNLVFEGGGVLGIAYAGALDVLESQQYLKNVKRVAGTSAGSIVSTLVALRCSAAEIKQIVYDTDFSTFMDFGIRFIDKYGLYKGQAFLEWMQAQIVKQKFSASATFRNLHDAGCLDLRVFATDLNTKGLKTFAFETTPDVPVAQEVRASMSIPLFFEAWKFPNGNPDNHIYVDGGTIYNYPITTFDSDPGTKIEDTLGFHLDNLSAPVTPSDLDYGHIELYVGSLFSTLLDAQIIDFEQSPDDVKRTVRIDNLGISATNFKITKEQKDALYASGLNATTKYLQKQLVSQN
jgi:NTE family protein